MKSINTANMKKAISIIVFPLLFCITFASFAHADGTTYVLNTNTKKFHYESCSSVRQMKEKNRQYTSMSYDEIISLGYSPCQNCNPRPYGDVSRSAASIYSAMPSLHSSVTYVVNTNTGKFHMPDCSSVSDMKQSNRLDTSKTFDELMAEGYEPCKKCDPR